jgi:hypothetical protein
MAWPAELEVHLYVNCLDTFPSFANEMGAEPASSIVASMRAAELSSPFHHECVAHVNSSSENRTHSAIMPTGAQSLTSLTVD